MEDLSRSVFVWPPARQSLFYREKLQLAGHLDRIARLVTHTSRPRTYILEDPAQFTESTVLKRKGSCLCKDRHFYDRTSARKKAKTCQRLNSKILDGWKDDPTDLDARYGMLWLVQDLVKELRLYGEYRVFVVAGKIVSVVGTTPAGDGVLLVKDCHGIYGLTELINQVLGNPEPQDVHVRRGGSADQRSKAMQALHEYVLQTLQGLVAEAEGIWDGPSVLRDFACLDVSFMEKQNPEVGFDYFVNKVELGGNSVCLFSAYSEATEMVMDELFGAILARYRNRLEVLVPRPVVHVKAPAAPQPVRVLPFCLYDCPDHRPSVHLLPNQKRKR
ncbi:hypothetical protein B0H10DRAFT_904860 [Mycena sp. CBHHK59/15]|nr:hypothetical protein B0H10DRAFT_904860 [Mycena sp. CBHHK59/15]